MQKDEIERLQQLLAKPSFARELEAGQQVYLMLKGSILALKQDASSQAIQILLGVVLQPPSPEIETDARSVLAELAQAGNLDAREALCQLILLQEDPQAVQITRLAGYAPRDFSNRALYFLLSAQFDRLDQIDPQQEALTHSFHSGEAALQKRILARARQADLGNWALTMQTESSYTPEDIEKLTKELPRFHSLHTQVFGLEVLGRLAKQGISYAREAIFDLFFEANYQPAGEYALQQNLLPEDPTRRALFFFLTSQWQRYEELDFNHTLLGAMYEAAHQELRLRIVSQTRMAGRVDWIQSIARGRRVRWLNDMSDADWEAVIRQLEHEQKWEDLWLLAQSCPPVWSINILRRLNAAGWNPGSFEEKELFVRLTMLAAEGAGQPVPLHQKKMANGLATGSLSLARSPQGNAVAVAGKDNQVVLVDPESHQVTALLPPLPAQVWCMAFNPSGDLLTTGIGDGRICIWRIRDEQLVKVMEGHTGLVKGVAFSPDGNMLYSVSFDRTLRAWRFPYGPEVKLLTIEAGEGFSLAIHPDGSSAAVGTGKGSIFWWSLPGGTPFPGPGGHTDTVSALTFSPDGRLLVSGSRDHSVSIWSIPGGHPVGIFTDHLAQVSALAIHPDGKLLASGDLNGSVVLRSFPEGRLLHRLETTDGPVVGLDFYEGEQLLIATRDGIPKIWDMHWLVFARQPEERAAPPNLTRLEQYLSSSSLTPVERNLVEYVLTLLRWKSRFDISLAEPQRVLTSEYDIEIMA